MSDEAIGAFGVLVSEAVSRLVDSHDGSLDKRAAMLKVESPTFLGSGGELKFEFKVTGNRQQAMSVGIDVLPEADEDDDDEFDALAVLCCVAGRSALPL